MGDSEALPGQTSGGTQGEREVQHLRDELAEEREQLAATNEVLQSLAFTSSDVGGVLETVLEAARRLCQADVGQVFLLKDDHYHLACGSGLSQEYLTLVEDRPLARDRGTLVGRVGLDRRATQIVDVLEDSEYSRPDAQRLEGFRTIMGVPMLLDGEVIGVLSVWRTEVNAFSERSVEVLTRFAAQAAVAIRTADLMTALRLRTTELARRVDQLESLGVVSQTVASSLDLTEVLTTIVTQAVQLSGTDGGSIFEFDEEEEEFRVRTVCGTSRDVLEALRHARMGLDDTFMGRAAKEGHPVQLPDLRDVPADPHLRVLDEGGWRSLMTVPLLWEGRIIGALVLRRRTPGKISEQISDLLEAFASQSALALVNARLYRRLKEQSEELEVVSRHKSEFLASMSHELRTPLNAVIGFSEVLLDRLFGELNNRQEEYLRDIWGSGRHLLALLNDILDLSKIEAGQMVLERTTFTVPEALEYCLTLVRERALKENVALSVETDPGVTTVRADRLRFNQVLLNLLSNAVKFTPAGGQVTVRAVMQGPDLVVSVTDTGVGVATEDHELIFHSFQQGAQGRRTTEGTGLGLTLSKRIVELHNGRIWLESRPGSGSTFGFSIPGTASSVAGTAESLEIMKFAADDESTPAGPPVVVVIEDDRRSFDLLRVYLETVGVQVVGARDGEEGLAMVRRLAPSGVVLDIVLPGMDGWDVLAQLKANPSTASIPVIVVSMLDERGRAVALGAAEYLVKPISKMSLLAAVQRGVRLPDADASVVAIDDDPLALQLFRAALEPEGWTVHCANSGAKGLALVRERRPAVVLLDLLMPEMDGFEVAEALHEDPRTAAIPVVVLTSMSMSSQEKDRLRGRISYVGRKSEFRAEDLAGILRQAKAVQRRPAADPT